MTTWQAIWLGAVQGATEFLPVSSDGHLLVAQHLLGLRGNELRFDVAVHGGTLLSLLVVFGRELPRLGWATWRDLAIATAVTAAIALPLRAGYESAFAHLWTAGAGFLASAAFLLASRIGRARQDAAGADAAGADAAGADAAGADAAGPRAAALIGAAQALAPLPGVSRSGVCIASALMCGLSPQAAGRFAFLLAIPAIAGALALGAASGLPAGSAGPGAMAAGAASAFAVGVACLRGALALVSRGRIHLFAWYLLPAGAAVLTWDLLLR